ncbi:MAG: cysteine-rich small domain-containing protein, partial [Oscillospiraceae bacterium]|nr:cysteine-rich small domain-containing protein [Oscillospiraceae bacterium]
MAEYDFFQHKKCEYFPCHKGADEETFSCLFCYCPLYALGDQCGGNFTYTENGIKDCSGCLRPHRRENYGVITEKMAQVLELAKKREA